jgi:RNA polymerase sigma-70 factor, ECF subfamily
VTHDTFITLHSHFETYDRNRPLKPWLFAFAFRVAADYRKLARNAREKLSETDDGFESKQSSSSRKSDPAIARADTLLEQKQNTERVHAAIQKIPEDRRAVFILAELDEVAMPEIATALGIPVNTAYSKLRLAREDFRAAITRSLATERSS